MTFKHTVILSTQIQLINYYCRFFVIFFFQSPSSDGRVQRGAVHNLGLCCFFAQQYDMTLNCFERALSLASDENMADVWYNIGHVAVVK